MAVAAKMTGFAVGDWTVEPDLGLIRRQGMQVALEPRVMDLLVYLAEHAGQTVSTNDLAEHVWSGRAVSDHPVYQGIAQLRKALSDEARHPRYIATVTKKGYRLIAPVTAAAAADNAAKEVTRGGRRYLAPALSLIVAGSYLFLASSDVSVSLERGASGYLTGGSIAVLPFVDMSADKDQQHIGDGIAEELIHRIAAVPDLKIVARTSSFTFRESDATVQEIGSQLGADYILEGSVRRSGDRLRVTAQLVSAADGYHVWSQSFEPIIAEAFAVQDQIADNVAALLQGGDEEPAYPRRSWTRSSEAADAYFLGTFHMHRRRAESLDKAIDYFKTAIAIDPTFALAYAGLAKTYFLASDFRYGNVSAELAAVEYDVALQKARSLDENLPEVLEQLASNAGSRGDSVEAQSLIRRAIEINPNYAPAYKVYGHVLGELGRLEDAAVTFEKAVVLDPLSPVLRINLGAAFGQLNRREESERHYQKAIELDPDWHVSYYSYGRSLGGGQYARAIQLGVKAYTVEGPTARMAGDAAMLVAYMYLSLEDFSSAGEWYEKARRLHVDPWWLANENLHWLLAQDRYTEADALLSEWEAKNTDYQEVYRFGGLYRAIMGQNEAARELLEHAAMMSTAGSISSLYEDSNLRWGYMPALYLAMIYINNGDDARGHSLLDDAERHLTKSERRIPGIPGALYVRAAVNALGGNDEAAMQALKRAADAGWARAWFLERDPIFDKYRNDPRLQVILLQMRTHIAAERRKLVQLGAADG